MSRTVPSRWLHRIRRLLHECRLRFPSWSSHERGAPHVGSNQPLSPRNALPRSSTWPALAPSGFHTQPWEFVVITKRNQGRSWPSCGRTGRPCATPTRRPRSRPLRCRPRLRHTARRLEGKGRAARCRPVLRCAGGQYVTHESRLRFSLHAARCDLPRTGLTMVFRGLWEKTQSGLKSLIGIPEGLRIFDMMVLGYAAEEPIPKDVRDSTT